ncbi:MAG TPA: FAD binding domain-containing protein [Spirochaetia bacterium]|nr:FAD binding domain-containing protein [Spirochaetia bacterium]
MSIWSNYVLAETLDEAIAALGASSGESCAIAGGTDLLLDLQQGHQAPINTLVDITRIPELGALEQRGMELFIGAAVPVREITSSPLVHAHAAAISEACGLIGGPQVRNTATLGGNVAHALPAADGMISLVALGATAEIANEEGMRRVPILELFLGPGRSALKRNRDVLVGFSIPLRKPGQASAFSRVMRPQGVALPILNAAVWIERGGNVISDVHVAVGPSGPVPQRATEIENIMIGGAFGDDLLLSIRDAIPAAFHFRSSAQRAGAEYRYQLCEVLLEEVITTAWKRAEAAR